MTLELPAPSLIRFEDARKVIRSVIAAKGTDFVYSPVTDNGCRRACMYFEISPEAYDLFETEEDREQILRDVPPACIVGHAVAAWGYSAYDIINDNETDVETLVTSLQLPVTRKALDYLTFLQGYQDSGVPWGEAEESAAYNVRESNTEHCGDNYDSAPVDIFF